MFAIMAASPHHTFQVLTKRAERMRDYFADIHAVGVRIATRWLPIAGFGKAFDLPLPNVWLGVSAERQNEADERIPHLLQTQAAVRFLSAEPLLGPLDIRAYLHGLHWVIAGGESGPGAREMWPAWPRSLRDQCAAADVAYFFKQWGAWHSGRYVGKKAAGRLLDHVEHNGMPARRSAA